MDNRNHDDNLDNLNIDGNEDIARAVNAARQAKQNGSRIAADAAAALSGDGMGHAAESETQMDDLAAAVREATERVHGTEQQQPAPQQPAQGAPDDGQLGLQDLAANAICQRLEAAAPETMTPIEALNFIFELKQLL